MQAIYTSSCCYVLFTLLIIISNWSCTKESTPALTGKWLMSQVVRDGQDVTPTHNPFKERYIVFKTDKSYASDGRPWGANTGKYIYNENKQRLILDSDVGPEDDSQWLIKITTDSMYWQGFGTDWAEQFKIVYERDKGKR